jgi:hypothetical protein
MIAGLTGNAASTLSSTGAGLLSAGMQGNEAGFGEAKEMQQQRSLSLNDLVSSIGSTAAGVFGAIPGGPGSFGDIASNVAGSVS